MTYETWEHLEMLNTFRAHSLEVSNEWLTVSESPEYEAYLLAEYDKQFNR